MTDDDPLVPLTDLAQAHRQIFGEPPMFGRRRYYNVSVAPTPPSAGG